MTAKEKRYFAFMLRLWQVPDGDEIFWRGSLENAHTGERHGFADLEDLIKLLVAEVEPGRPLEDKPKAR